jgi:DNA primase
VNLTDYFQQHFDEELNPNAQGECAAHCLFHDDERASMSINIQTGLWRCFGCDRGGDVYTFQELVGEVDFADAKAQLDEMGVKVPPRPEPDIEFVGEGKKVKVDESTVTKLVAALWDNAALLSFLRDKRGLSDDTIHHFQLGWNPRTKRITIPVRDEAGDLVNIRQYSPTDKATGKVISWAQGFGAVRLFPIHELTIDEPIVICEGEMDTMLAHQLGFNSVTSTGGAGTWRTAWSDVFQGRDVAICYDVDAAGEKGAHAVARALLDVANEIRIVKLPLSEPKGADITNYIVDNGYSASDLSDLIAHSPVYKLEPLVPEDDTIYNVPLSEASQARYNNRRVAFDAVVAGKDLAPFIIPSKVMFRCGVNKKTCEVCRLGMAGGQMEYRVGERSPDLLLLRGVATYTQRNILKQLADINPQCHVEVEVAETLNIEELLLIPELTWSSAEQAYVTRRAYIIDHGVPAGTSFRFEGLTIPDPQNQYATHLLYHKQHAQDDVERFKMTPALRKELSVFQPAKGQTARDKLNEIAHDLSTNVTRIYGRMPLHIAVDLAFHSMVGFHFGGKAVRKGWLEIMLLGDTRTGKTETCQQLIEHYNAGEFVTGESSSYAGLVGGLQQTQNRWSITWGKIPLNDRRLVVIDEVSGLTTDAIANMSGIRSSGIAELTKIQTERARARTRLIWVSNPREGVALNDRTYPVTFLRTLIGKAEDIARFDLIVPASSSDVPATLINSGSPEVVAHIYNSKVCHHLILWAWSRTPDQVKFSTKAVAAIYREAISLGQRYSSEIPLIESADARIKLARLSAAIATRLFSTDASGEVVQVTEEHVITAVAFLDELYGNTGLKYAQYSLERIKERQSVIDNRDAIVAFLNRYLGLRDFLNLYDSFSKQDLVDYTGLDQEDAREVVKFLFNNRLVRRGSGYIRKRPAFIALLEDLEVSEE